MTISERMTAAKPYIWGVVTGAVVAPIIAFSLDWVVTTGTMNEAVAMARVEQAAAICAGNAMASWQAEDNDIAALRGWENREQRSKLVAQVAASLPGIEAIQAQVVRKCDDLLRA